MKKLVSISVLVMSLGCVAIATLVAAAGRSLSEPFPPSATAPRELVIESGTAAPAILRRLEAEQLIRHAWLARLYLIHVLDDPALMAGEYSFSPPMRAVDVLGKLTRGEVSSHPVTIIEGLDLEETAAVIAAAGFGDLDLLRAQMNDPRRILDLDSAAVSLEGYLFPDTYRFARGTSEEQIVDTLVDTFRQRLAEAGGASESGVRELVTLASIVEMEAQLDDERPLIAGVFSNRLERGMALGADPTVIFALKLEGRWDGNIRRPDLQMDSPYNTYRNVGLPPGPICSPGLASLQAAARPAAIDSLYFVSRNDGSHVFARTLAEHNRNVDVWQKQYWRERWARERRQAAEDG